MEFSKTIKKSIDIELAKKIRYEPGIFVAHKNNDFIHTLLKYEGKNAIVEVASDKSELSFPANEIFDINNVRDIAVQIEMFGDYIPGRTVINLI